jgi:hypothetical protein
MSMFEFAPLGFSELLGPMLVAGAILAAGAAVIVMLEGVFIFIHRAGSRLADKLHERHAGP